MAPGKHHARTELVREALARAWETARRSAEIRATAAELTVIAGDLCFRARAERERAQELASERLGRGHADAAIVHPGTGRLSPAIRGPRRVDRGD